MFYYIALLFEMARKFLFSGGLRDLKWYRTGLKEKEITRHGVQTLMPTALYPAVEIDLLVTNYLT